MPKVRPEITASSVPLGRCEFLDDTMTANELLEVLDGLQYRREQHAVLLDRGVREYLCAAVRAVITIASFIIMAL
jgi:hypothetical protein